MTTVLAAFRRQPALRSGWLLAAALFTLTSALIYLFGAADADFALDALTGWLLVAAGLIQAGAAVALVAWPARGVSAAAIAVDALLAILWAVSRTVGLPFGPAPWSPWQLGPTDLLCTAFALFAALVLLWLVVCPAPRPSRGRAWRGVLGLLVAFVFASYLGFAAKVTAEVDIPAPPLALVHIVPGQMTTFTYCSPDPAGLAMDFYPPSVAAARPVPVLLQIHGGVGIYGDRKDVLIPSVQELNAAGFAVASIDYRRAPMVVMASQVEDAQCAVRFLRANAATLGIDPDRIGAFGHSEGGWLSAMLGLAGPRAGDEASQYQGVSSQVQAAVDEAGPADLPRLLQEGPIWMSQAAFVLYRGQPVSAPPDNSSVDYVRPGAPPFLIIQGTDDEVIPFQQSAELAERLRAAGDAVQFVPVQHGPHDLQDATETPAPAELGHLVTAFFVAALQPSVQ